MDEPTRTALAEVLHRCLHALRPALSTPAYNLVLNVAPNAVARPGKADYWSTLHLDYHWHIEILPRVTSVAGFEWGTGFYINPVSPEDAARYLRETLARVQRGET
jgi:UDPglucose--hexose-1-phosphate uridylyltransferase